MPLKSFVNEARKTNALIDKMTVNQKGSEDSILDISDGQKIPDEKLEEIKNTNRSSLPSSIRQQTIPKMKDYTPFEREHIRKNQEREIAAGGCSSGQIVDDRHNNIIATIIKDSNVKPRGKTSWENCKHKKATEGSTYCTEFHSLCGKEKCKRATE